MTTSQTMRSASTTRRHTSTTTWRRRRDRKSTRLNSSHVAISYAVFCLKKKKKNKHINDTIRKKNSKRENKIITHDTEQYNNWYKRQMNSKYDVNQNSTNITTLM